MYSGNSKVAGKLILAFPNDPPIPALLVSVSTILIFRNSNSSSEFTIAAVHPASKIKLISLSTTRGCL